MENSEENKFITHIQQIVEAIRKTGKVRFITYFQIGLVVLLALSYFVIDKFDELEREDEISVLSAEISEIKRKNLSILLEQKSNNSTTDDLTIEELHKLSSRRLLKEELESKIKSLEYDKEEVISRVNFKGYTIFFTIFIVFACIELFLFKWKKLAIYGVPLSYIDSISEFIFGFLSENNKSDYNLRQAYRKYWNDTVASKINSLLVEKELELDKSARSEFTSMFNKYFWTCEVENPVTWKTLEELKAKMDEYYKLFPKSCSSPSSPLTSGGVRALSDEEKFRLRQKRKR
ncbi:MAG: hypothetical protein DWQ06_16630 [Calditrichaeota bacterium]|nr:MAG: hypothetical protein DWQ06_16630 [Calditrichota bacterium]